MTFERKKTLVHWLSRRGRGDRAAVDRGPSSLADVLSKLEPTTQRHRPLIGLEQWSQVVGPRLASRSLPERTDEQGTLIVRVPSSAWAQELAFHSQVIVSRLRSHGVDVRRVRFVIGPIDRQQKQRTEVEKRNLIPLERLPEPLEKQLERVENEQLRALLRRAASVSLGRAVKSPSGH